MTLRTEDFDYPLDPARIAQAPAQRRDESRLMTLDRATGRRGHRVFSDLPELLAPGDLLVVNNTKVIPARFFARRATGGRIEGLFLRQGSDGAWCVLLKGASRCRPGERLGLVGSEAELELLARGERGEWMVQPHPHAPAETLLNQAGTMPLPPYIHRDAAEDRPADRLRYQTVYAAQPGAVAAPTAGLHFTPELFSALDRRGVQQAQVTLHVGLGTFAPVTAEDPTRHAMHAEWYDLGVEAVEAIRAARQRGSRVVAVGTTSVRVLETVAAANAGHLRAEQGWTQAFIYPPAKFAAVDALITNFHLPRSTLLMLVAAFCAPGGTEGIEMILNAYKEAAEREYRFYSYGDAMLIG